MRFSAHANSGHDRRQIERETTERRKYNHSQADTNQQHNEDCIAQQPGVEQAVTNEARSRSDKPMQVRTYSKS